MTLLDPQDTTAKFYPYSPHSGSRELPLVSSLWLPQMWHGTCISPRTPEKINVKKKTKKEDTVRHSKAGWAKFHEASLYGRRMSPSGEKWSKDSTHRKESLRGTWKWTGKGCDAGLGPSETQSWVANPSMPVISSDMNKHPWWRKVWMALVPKDSLMWVPVHLDTRGSEKEDICNHTGIHSQAQKQRQAPLPYCFSRGERKLRFCSWGREG